MTTLPILRVLSLGAGVQSTTMALMAAHGEIEPMPDCAMFADTGWEPAAVYDHLRWLLSGNVLPFPVHIVSAGNLRADLMAGGSERAGRFITVPFYLKRHGSNGRVHDGIGRRQCTTHYKIEPMRRKIRELLGKDARARIPAGAIEKWIGISLDELVRATPARVQYETNRFPLLEQRMSRRDCLAWLKRHGYPTPPKSACNGCPFHSNEAWRRVKADPVAWADVVEVDKAIRVPGGRVGVEPMRAQQFMHPQRKPIDEVDFSTAEDRGQGNLFLHECDGLCGN